MKQTMKKLLSIALATAISSMAVADFVNTDELGGLESLRSVNISEEAPAEPMAKVMEGKRYDLEFVEMPPLVPHQIDRSQTDLNANTCLQCHSSNNASKWGATRVAVSHYKNRDGEQLSAVSPDRYFCLACHVPQHDSKPLKENTFEPVQSLKP
ncbi:nitrate reductase cytochrome c-type subunit [Endozoicomonas montiporae]|nr:nitrate reductase cytochrome c-type subunit [Endozoicomonas montiporae]